MDLQRLPRGWSHPNRVDALLSWTGAIGEIAVLLGYWWLTKGAVTGMLQFVRASTAFELSLAAGSLYLGVVGGTWIAYWGAHRGNLLLVAIHLVIYHVVLAVIAGLVVLNGAQFVTAHPGSFSPAIMSLASDRGAGMLATGVGFYLLERRSGWDQSIGLVSTVWAKWDRIASIVANFRTSPSKT